MAERPSMPPAGLLPETNTSGTNLFFPSANALATFISAVGICPSAFTYSLKAIA